MVGAVKEAWNIYTTPYTVLSVLGIYLEWGWSVIPIANSRLGRTVNDRGTRDWINLYWFPGEARIKGLFFE